MADDAEIKAIETMSLTAASPASAVPRRDAAGSARMVAYARPGDDSEKTTAGAKPTQQAHRESRSKSSRTRATLLDTRARSRSSRDQPIRQRT